MPLSSEKLEKLLRGEDAKAIVKFFKGAVESDRRAVAPQVIAWRKRLDANWRAQFNKKAAAEVERDGAIKNWYELTPVATLAVLACANLDEIKALDLRVPVDAAVAVLADRRPAWLDNYAETLCEGELTFWSDDRWAQVRALVKSGLCKPPKHDHYALRGLTGIWPRFQPGKPEPKLVNQLLRECDWLETDFWRLFELDGTGEVSFANCDKYRKSRNSWAEALVELSQRGVLSRDRLLDASLAALSRDFIQFRSGWFSRFHEALEPTPAERLARVDAYLRLLASSIPPTVAFALNAVAIVDKFAPLPADKLIETLQPALNAEGKAVVKTALNILEAAAKREPNARTSICRAVVPALLNETTDVQKAVFDFVDRHGDKTDATLRNNIEQVREAVAASLKPRLKPWLGESAAQVNESSNSLKSPRPCAVPSRIDPSRAIKPIENLDDLIHVAAAILEDAADPKEIERLLDGLSRLCHERPDDFEKRTAPLRKRAHKKREKSANTLERELAGFLISWLDEEDKFSETEAVPDWGKNQYSFLLQRLRVIARHVQQRKSMPLLSAPTHVGGWIEPKVLVQRWHAWQKSKATMDSSEQVLALLRMAPEGRKEALPAAKGIEGEAGRAVRFALGQEQKTGKDAALWLAAWRSRQPFGDLPQFEAAHPCLGPDAGVAARYTWRAEGKRHEYSGGAHTTLNLYLQREPSFPKETPADLLPVLFHGVWQTHEEGEKYLMRWATTVWPANREAAFAHGAKRLEASVGYADVNDREFCAYAEPLADPYTELRPMACLALALCFAAEDGALRGHGQDALIAAISEERVNLDELGSTMSRLLDTGVNKLARWAKALRDVSRVSGDHAKISAELITRTLHGDPTKAPRDVSTLLELLFELLSETNGKLDDACSRKYLAGLTTGGKTGKLVKQLLAA